MKTTIGRFVSLAVAAMAAVLAVSGPVHGQVTPAPSGDVRQPPAPQVDEIWARSETDLGIPSRPPSEDEPPGEAGVLDGDPWLPTRARQFVTIKKDAYFRGGNRTPNGIQMSSSFVAATAAHVAVHFSAEAFVDTIGGGGPVPPAPSGRSGPSPVPRRMFVRALMDGKPANPGDVVFTSGPVPGAKTFVFTTDVQPGVHTVEMQWMVDRPAPGETDVVGRMRDASLLVRQGTSARRADGSDIGEFETRTPASGPNQVKADNVWAAVPDMQRSVRVASGGPLVATFSAESRSTGAARMGLRALVDGVPMSPADVVFAKGRWASRSATFVALQVAPGVHTVRFEWLADGAGTVEVGDRSMALAGFANPAGQPSHPAVALGGADATDETGPAPGMTLPVWVPARGNGEVAVIASAEISSSGAPAAVGLAVDGGLRPETAVELNSGEETQVRSWTFDVKNLAPGLHEVSVWLLGSPTSEVFIGDRAMAAVAETGAIPDLAEAALLGFGHHGKGDNVVGIEAVIGSRPVLTVLFDAHRPDHPNDITTDELGQTFDRVAGFYGAVSGGRFVPGDAGAVGPYDALEDGDAYWSHPTDENGKPLCVDGHNDGHKRRRSEAVTHASADVDFSTFDRNGDGRVEPDELAIVVAYKELAEGDESFQFGQALQGLAAESCGTDEPLVLDGVEIPSAVEWFTDRPSDEWIVMAHELGHHVLGLDDHYYGDTYQQVAHRVNGRSLMGPLSAGITPHLDPAVKLALGWVTPRTVLSGGHRTLTDVKLREVVDVLPRWNSTRADEYFVVENRQADLGWGQEDDGIGESGLLVWHAAEDPADNVNVPIGTDIGVFNDSAYDTQTRRGIRLLHPWTEMTDGVAGYTASTSWFAGRYALLSGPCPPVVPGGVTLAAMSTLTWADCTPSPYGLRNWSPLPAAPDPLDPPSTEMGFDVLVAP